MCDCWEEKAKFHTYNPSLQIHAGCVLYNQFRRVMRIYADRGCGLEGTFRSIVGLEASSQICTMKLLKEENAILKEENRRLRRESAAMSLLKGENSLLREENERLGARLAAAAAAPEEEEEEDRTKTNNVDDASWEETGKPALTGCLGLL